MIFCATNSVLMEIQVALYSVAVSFFFSLLFVHGLFCGEEVVWRIPRSSSLNLLHSRITRPMGNSLFRLNISQQQATTTAAGIHGVVLYHAPKYIGWEKSGNNVVLWI